jgi:hypothetical protein
VGVGRAGGKKGGRNGVKKGSNPGDKESGVLGGMKEMVERRVLVISVDDEK